MSYLSIICVCFFRLKSLLASSAINFATSKRPAGPCEKVLKVFFQSVFAEDGACLIVQHLAAFRF